MPSLRHLIECMFLNRPSREPAADWRRQRDSHANVPLLDTAWHQRFSGVANAARAVAGYRNTLDPDG